MWKWLKAWYEREMAAANAQVDAMLRKYDDRLY